MSNQFKLRLGKAVTVFCYRIEIDPMPFFDASLYHQVLRFKSRYLETLLGLYVCSGQNIYVLNELDESLKFSVVYKQQQLEVTIDVSTVSNVTLGGNEKWQNADNDVQ